jgi:hypothetical protein
VAEPTLVYFFGPPACGKSTLMAELTKNCERSAVASRLPHDVLFRGTRLVGVEMGRRRPAFSGTDALSMSIHPKAVSWVGLRPHSLILGEGARLATVGFLKAAEAAGYRVFPFHMKAPEDLLAERRRIRGSRQNEAWMRGAATRAENLARELSAPSFFVDAPPGELAVRVRGWVPALEVLL